MRNKFYIITAFLIILLTNIGLTSVFAAPMIEELSFDSQATNQDQLIFKMNGEYMPKSFALSGDRPRLVFDFLDVVPSKKVQNTIDANGTFIKKIRTGIHKGKNPKTRIVLDLQAGMKIDHTEVFNSDTNTLVISIFPAGMPPETMAEAEEQPEPEATGTIQEQPAEAALPQTEKAEQSKPLPEETVAEVAPEKPTQVATGPEQAPEKVQPAMPQVSTQSGMEESTVIQPLSEIGDKEATGQQEPSVPALSSVEFNDTSYRGEIVSFQLNGFHPPVVFGIEEDVPRIVCFFKGTRGADKLAENIGTNGKYIKNIKIGKYRNPDNVRVVLDLVPGKNYDLQQIFFKEDNLFMVIINTTGEKVNN